MTPIQITILDRHAVVTPAVHAAKHVLTASSVMYAVGGEYGCRHVAASASRPASYLA